MNHDHLSKPRPLQALESSPVRPHKRSAANPLKGSRRQLHVREMTQSVSISAAGIQFVLSFTTPSGLMGTNWSGRV